jgi:hypothetical protein
MNPQVKVSNKESKDLFGAFGIPAERKEQIIKRTQEVVKNAISGGKDKADTLADVWNEFESPEETACAVFILSSAEEEVMVHELFRLPEAVGEKENA